ncbi:hypothetical protein MAPG_10644 [Magnaporthiopsis poae ATCC 64411]|uniref:BTB domain-containing protein n=1 Tax=Magnaporthiopsis poae (strain ATCC 64411 / 73-15) TaxID=644358 RepID=A0A0C4ED51_MAGP6|nr:hypothetical protein MAPG_10644 [Magnaporthiopsis poae ATCC 64411]
MAGPKEEPQEGLGGFEVSPFSSAMVSLKFADGAPLSIHRSVLLRCPKLGLLDSWTKTIDLGGFSVYAGHALVSYLYSGEYKKHTGLRWTLPLCPTANVGLAELASRFEIYALARSVELDGLEEQVRDEIDGIADHLDMFTVIDAVRETYPTLIGNDTWFPPWIKSVIKKAFKDPKKLSGIPASPDFRAVFSVTKLLLGCMMETYTEMVDVIADGLGVAEPHTPVTDGSFEDAEGDEGLRPPQKLQMMLTRDPDVAKPIPGPQASDKERGILRVSLANRNRPTWWLALVPEAPPPVKRGRSGTSSETEAEDGLRAEDERALDAEPCCERDETEAKDGPRAEDERALDAEPRCERELALGSKAVHEPEPKPTLEPVKECAAPVPWLWRERELKLPAAGAPPEPTPEPTPEPVDAWEFRRERKLKLPAAGAPPEPTPELTPEPVDAWGWATTKKSKKKGKKSAVFIPLSKPTHLAQVHLLIPPPKMFEPDPKPAVAMPETRGDCVD